MATWLNLTLQFILHKVFSTYTDSTTSHWQCDFILTVWLHTDSVTSYWQYDFILRVWLHTDSVTSYWQCDFILTVWLHTDSVTSHWQCDFILTVWLHTDSVTSYSHRDAISCCKQKSFTRQEKTSQEIVYSCFERNSKQRLQSKYCWRPSGSLIQRPPELTNPTVTVNTGPNLVFL